MGNTLILGAKIWDASGAPAFPGDVLVEGNRIRRYRACRVSFPAPTAR